MKTAPLLTDLPAIFAPTNARRWVIGSLAVLLLFFGQTFHYLMAVWILWAISKAFPILSLPAILALRNYPRFPMSRQILITMTWLILVPSFAAGIYFHQSFFTSLTAQVKLLPFLYFFSFLALLLTLQPTLYEIERSFIRLAKIIAVVLIFFWLLIPDSWYSTTYVVGDAPFFSHDHRGNRIRMSMYFPIIALFFCFRRAVFEKSMRYATGTIILLAVVMFIVKTRAMVIGIAGVLALNTILWSRPLVRVLLLIIAPLALIAVFSVGYLGTTFSTDASTGFDTRQISINHAIRFLSDDPLRWILGVGTISPTSQDSLIAYFHHFFFLADITWLGIVFEYGLLGAVLLLMITVRGLFFYQRLRTYVEDDFLGSLRDYLIYILMISAFYPLTLTPGETAVILAIFVYVWYAGELEQTAKPRALHGQPHHS
jgi:hypothetical protein